MYSEHSDYIQNHPGVSYRGATVAYLLGLGPMPPPKPQEVAVAALYAQLNNPQAFENAELACVLQEGCGHAEETSCKYYF
jgi:hypothetical protein